MTDAGYEVVIADDGVDGIAKFDDSISLVLLDIMLPKIDGYGVCEVIRQKSQVPIIMLTALSDEENQLDVYKRHTVYPCVGSHVASLGGRRGTGRQQWTCPWKHFYWSQRDCP